MSDLIDRQTAIDALEKVADFFPWKVPGKSDTYDRYNEGWNDAIGRAEMEIENLPSAQPETDSNIENAIRVLQSKYNKALSNDYIHNPIAWALYQTWKGFDK